MYFVGLDLAWGERKPTGVAVVDAGGRLVHAGAATDDDSIRAALAPYVQGDCVVGIDAPLIVTNPTGQRPAERQLNADFARFQAGAHPTNTGKPEFADTPRGARLAEVLGLDIAPDSTAPRRAIEVYPHAAAVALFRLGRTLKYKAKPGRTVAGLRAELLRLMEHIDLSPLLKNPKWIVGFSDVTVLHNALHNLGISTLHAQMPHNIGVKTAECVETLRKALFGENYAVVSGERQAASDVLAPAAKDLPLAADRPGTCEAELIGGNLSLLYALRGTPYDIDPRGKILFIEDLDELLYHVDRMVMNLQLAGWFKELAGLVVGGMADMHDRNPADPFGQSAEAIIAQAVAPYDYPVCYGFPAGHIPDNRALVLGQKAKLSVTTSGATLVYNVPTNARS